MGKHDGNLVPWLQEQEAAIQQLSAKDVSFRLSDEGYGVFLRSLLEDADAKNLLTEFLPRCNVPHLIVFTVLIASTPIEEALLQSTRKRGQKLKAVLRVGARKGQQVRRRLAKADKAFDTRRRGLGLAQYNFGLLILRGYLRYKCGQVPSARDLAALLKAGLAASGKSAMIDYDLLRRNLKNYEKKSPDLCRLATGERCAEIIESSHK